MKQKVIAALLLAGAISSTVAQAAPIQWTTAGGNGHWYDLVSSSSQITWASAATDAMTHTFNGVTGNLASITSAAENDWVFANISKGTTAWFGGTQSVAGNQSSWKWSNGESWGFTAWAPGQPDNFAGGTQRTMYYAGAGKYWHDAPDTWSGIPKVYVVEYAAPVTAPVPEPETYAMMLAGLGLLGFMARRRKQKSIA